MCNGSFRDSCSSAYSGLKVIIPDKNYEQESSIIDKKRQFSEPMHIGEILPLVMRDIEKRMQRHHRVEVDIDITNYTTKK